MNEKTANRRRLNYYEVYDMEGDLLAEGTAKEIESKFNRRMYNIKKSFEVLHVGYSYLLYAVYKGDKLLAEGDYQHVTQVMGWYHNTLGFYLSKSYKERAKNRGKGLEGNITTAVRLEEREVRYFD